MVTAGLMCAPLYLLTQKTATKTAIPHPAVMTIHPPPLPLVRLSTTLATTPLPRMTRIAVPMISARKGFMRGAPSKLYDDFLIPSPAVLRGRGLEAVSQLACANVAPGQGFWLN